MWRDGNFDSTFVQAHIGPRYPQPLAVHNSELSSIPLDVGSAYEGASVESKCWCLCHRSCALPSLSVRCAYPYHLRPQPSMWLPVFRSLHAADRPASSAFGRDGTFEGEEGRTWPPGVLEHTRYEVSGRLCPSQQEIAASASELV